MNKRERVKYDIQYFMANFVLMARSKDSARGQLH